MFYFDCCSHLDVYLCSPQPDDDEYLNPSGGTEGLHSADKPVTLHDIMSWCYQIARGMEYLASIDVS